jgi:hypothetical protein
MAYDSSKQLLRPYQNISPYEVIPHFSLDAESANKGTFVKAAGNGVVFNDTNYTWAGGITSAGDVGANFPGVISNRYRVTAQCSVAGTGDANKVLGVLLYDVRATDENGDRLVIRPGKADELQCVVSGQAVPIASRGHLLYYVTGSATAGQRAYIDGSGEINVNATLTHNAVAVGKFLGAQNGEGYALIKLEL